MLRMHQVLRKRCVDYEEKLAVVSGELDDLRKQRDEYEDAISSLDEACNQLRAQVWMTGVDEQW